MQQLVRRHPIYIEAKLHQNLKNTPTYSYLFSLSLKILKRVVILFFISFLTLNYCNIGHMVLRELDKFCNFYYVSSVRTLLKVFICFSLLRDRI